MGCTVSRPRAPPRVMPPPLDDAEEVTFFVKQQRRTNNYHVYQGDTEDEDLRWLYLHKDQSTSVLARASRMQAKEDGVAVRSSLSLEAYDASESSGDDSSSAVYHVHFDPMAAFEQDGKAHKPSKSLGGKFCSQIDDGTRMAHCVVYEHAQITKPNDDEFGMTLTVQAKGAAVKQYNNGKKVEKSIDEIQFNLTGSDGAVLASWVMMVPDDQVLSTGDVNFRYADWENDLFKITHTQGAPPPGSPSKVDPSLDSIIDKTDAQLNRYCVTTKPGSGFDPALALIIAHCCEVDYSPNELLDNFRPTFDKRIPA